MDSVFVDPERWQAWDLFVQGRDDSGFMQASWWVRFRETLGFDHFGIVLRSDGEIVGGAIVCRWTFAPGHCFYNVPDGPLLPRGDEPFARRVLAALLERIECHRQADPDRVSHLRIEPRGLAAADLDLPGFAVPTFDDVYREPRHSLWLDLRDDDAGLLARMKPKGRYNVRTAVRHGVTIESDASPAGLQDFLRLYCRTMTRHDLSAKPPSYFRALLAQASPDATLLFARCGGRRVATALVLRFGRRATYFYGGSLVLHRRAMAPYLLHFEAARRAREQGCAWYDLWGVGPRDDPGHPWQAISEFKRKFGGVEVDRGPAVDRIYDADAYARFRSEAESDHMVTRNPNETPAACEFEPAARFVR